MYYLIQTNETIEIFSAFNALTRDRANREYRYKFGAVPVAYVLF